MTPSHELSSKIRALLLAEWDPIEVRDVPAAQDEYESYIGGVARLIDAGNSALEIADYLLNAEVKDMGLTGDRERAQLVANKLAMLGSAIRASDASSRPI